MYNVFSIEAWPTPDHEEVGLFALCSGVVNSFPPAAFLRGQTTAVSACKKGAAMRVVGGSAPEECDHKLSASRPT